MARAPALDVPLVRSSRPLRPTHMPAPSRGSAELSARSLPPHLDDDDFDRLLAAIHIAMLLAGRVGAQPVRLPRFPRHLLQRPTLAVHQVERAAFQGDDRPAVIVAMEREWLVGKDDRLPYPDVIVLELRLTPRLR